MATFRTFTVFIFCLPPVTGAALLLRFLTAALSLAGTERPQRGERTCPSHGSLHTRGPFNAGRQPKALTDKSAADCNSSADRHNARSSGEKSNLCILRHLDVARL